MTRNKTAEITVASVGCLEVLSVGKGDLKLTWDADDPEDEGNARATIEEMLRKGYTILVETDVGPARVQRFSKDRMEYIISEVVPGHELPSGPPPMPALSAGAPAQADEVLPPKRGRGRPKRTREAGVPVAGSRATAVGRTAGG